jgi:hypothetical protein
MNYPPPKKEGLGVGEDILNLLYYFIYWWQVSFRFKKKISRSTKELLKKEALLNFLFPS